MKINIQKKIGKETYSFEFDSPDFRKGLALAGMLAQTPTKCSLCNSENVSLSANKNKGITFVKVLCKDCNARANFGEYKDGGFFWHEWEKYEAPSRKAREDDNIPVVNEGDKEIDVNDLPL
jgi:transcription elongation factor Elf1